MTLGSISIQKQPAILLGALLIFLMLPTGFLVGQMPADSVFKDFRPNGDLIMVLGGEELKHAELFFSERAGAFLVMAPELASPVLVGTRTGTVETVHLMKVRKRDDGAIDLLADAALDQIGRFEIKGAEVHFNIKGQPALLKPKPALVGFQPLQSMKEYKPEYDQLSQAYNPNAAAVNALSGETRDVELLIYFGTWCPTCGRLVPRVMKMADQLADSKINVRFYGLPRDMKSDPRTEKDNVRGVPTGIVYIGGKEVKRMGVQELNQPETALREILGR